MTQISDEDIAKLKALAEAATPGPWTTSGATSVIKGDRFMFVIKDDVGEISRLPLPDKQGKGYAPTICDLRFIAAANPMKVLSLIARAEAAEEERDEALKPATEIEIEYADDEEGHMDCTIVYNEISHGNFAYTEGSLTRTDAAKIINAFLAHRRALKKEPS